MYHHSFEFYPAFDIKQFVSWNYHVYLSECLPEPLQKSKFISKDPDTLINEFEKRERELEKLTSQSAEDYVKEYFDKLSDDEKRMIDTCLKKIIEIKQWQPQHTSSKHIKNKLLERLEAYTGNELYKGNSNWTDFDSATLSQAQAKISHRRTVLEDEIKKMKSEFIFAVERVKELEIYEQQLLEDLKLLG